MRLVGIALVSVCCFSVGLIKALNLVGRTSALTSILTALEQMKTLIIKDAPLMIDILKELEDMSKTDPLDFIKLSIVDLENGESFEKAWKDSVQATRLAINNNDKKQLAALGDILGRTWAELEQVALDNVISTLKQSLDEAVKDKRERFNLYTSLGALGGAAAFIILI